MSGAAGQADRIAAVRDHPHELDDYRSWLRRRSGPRDYLFSADRVRFEPRRQDVVVPAEGLRIAGRREAVLKLGGAELEARGLSPAQARRLVAAMDGERCLAELAWEGREALAALLRAGFGKVLFAPAAVAALEAELAGVEIVRFPAAPYAIDRSYWHNAIDVRRRLDGLHRATDAEGFVEALRSLHVVMLMGGGLDSFYQPASPGADEAVDPGALFDAPVRLRRHGDRTTFLDGPRVDAKILGGEAYGRALFEGVGDAEAMGPRPIEDEGLDWGEVVLARSERDETHAPWFCPPRPMTAAHFERVWQAFVAGSEGEVEALADLHWRLVRLHPFRCGNQSLTMTIVNACLEIGIPHLLLDCWALRLTRSSYRRLFRRAVDAWAIGGEPAERLRRLIALRTAWQRTVERIEAGEPAAVVADDDPTGARAALVC